MKEKKDVRLPAGLSIEDKRGGIWPPFFVRSDIADQRRVAIATNLRINEMIRSPQVRLISQDGQQLGIKAIEDAQRIALEADLDLVEVAPNANPPVCKILDYGKYCYEQEQKKKAARKKQSVIVVKEMKMRPKIDIHDYETKKKHVIRFINHGDRVKVTIMFRGREMTHTELGLKLLNRLAADLADIAVVESKPKLDGRNMTMMLVPSGTGDKKE